MNYDELAFLNQQLAGMLKAGIPLEGALRQLSATMRRGELRTELEQLHQDLSAGTPIEAALEKRNLPALYKRMVSTGARGQDLPGMLTLLADHYARAHALWVRLKGVMVYPVIVLLTSACLSIGLAWVFNRVFLGAYSSSGFMRSNSSGVLLLIWILPVGFSLVLVALALAGVVPALRQRVRWRLTAFRDASLAQLGFTLSMLLAGGSSLRDSLDLLEQVEDRGPIKSELSLWRRRLAEGCSKFNEVSSDSRVVPPLFVWLVTNSGDDLSDGFRRAADIYQSRAMHRADMLLYTAMPVLTLLLGVIIILQAYYLVRIFTTFISLFLF